MKFTIYDLQTGRVIFGGEADDPEALLQPEQGVLLEIEEVSGYVIDAVHYALPEQPSPNHTFNYVTKVWEDLRTLQEVKAAKNAAIDRSREAVNQTFFLYEGMKIAVDPISKGDIMGAHGDWLTGQAPQGWPGGWKTLEKTEAGDPVYVPLPDLESWLQFYRAMVATGTANFNHSQALKDRLAAATTVAEVDDIPNW